MRQFIGSTSFMDGILMIGTLDHLQTQKMYGRQFLLAHSVITCIE